MLLLSVFGFVPQQVSLHVERFSMKHNLLHAAISFSDGHDERRFDFRPFVPPGQSYETTVAERLHYGQCMVDFLCLVEVGSVQDSLLTSKQICWGTTTKSWAEILDYEAHLAKRRYVMGVYDCRHFSSELALFTTGRRTPVWDLHRLL